MTSLHASATDVIVYTVAGVLVILCCSMIIVILIMMRRRRKTVGQATGQCIPVCDHYSTVGSVLQVMITIQ